MNLQFGRRWRKLTPCAEADGSPQPNGQQDGHCGIEKHCRGQGKGGDEGCHLNKRSLSWLE